MLPMTKTFTENDLVRFLYNDLTLREREEIENSLINSVSLQEKLRMLEEAKELVGGLLVKAPKRAVENILRISKSTEISDFQE